MAVVRAPEPADAAAVAAAVPKAGATGVAARAAAVMVLGAAR